MIRDSTRLAVAFQDPALLPWKSARDNVGFALLGAGLSREARCERAEGYLTEVGLPPEAWDKYPRQLSGGMRQRVALARVLAVRPDLLLCDEPFSRLDARSRKGLGALPGEIHAREGLPPVVVAHDSEAALALADVLVVMSMRRVEQVGAPEEIPANPVSASVAAKLGG